MTMEILRINRRGHDPGSPSIVAEIAAHQVESVVYYRDHATLTYQDDNKRWLLCIDYAANPQIKPAIAAALRAKHSNTLTDTEALPTPAVMAN